MKLHVILVAVLLASSIFCVELAQAQTEEIINLSTYYPAPLGEYDELSTNKFIVNWPGVYPVDRVNEFGSMGDEGDVHIGNSLIVGAGEVNEAGGTGFSYKELTAAGTPPNNGDVLIKGNVGIGTTIPDHKVHVETDGVNTFRGVSTVASSPAAGAGITFYSDDGAALASGDRLGYVVFGGNNGAGGLDNSAAIAAFAGADWAAGEHPSEIAFEVTPAGSTTRSEAMRIDNQGNLGIGDPNPGAKLVVGESATDSINMFRIFAPVDANGELVEMSIGKSLGESGIIGYIYNTTLADAGIYISNYGDAAGAGVFVRKGGNVGIGTTSPDYNLEVAGTVAFPDVITDSGVVYDKLAMTAQGKIILDASSSRRYKKDITDLEIDTSKIYELRPVSFTWKSSGERDFGLIAEDVDEVLPEMVTYDKEGKPRGVRYEEFSVLLLAELKKLKTELKEFKGLIEEQQKAIAALQRR